MSDKIGHRHSAVRRTSTALLAAGLVMGPTSRSSLGIVPPPSPDPRIQLTGFEAASRSQPSDGRIPVRWSRTRVPWLTDPAQCREFWHARQIRSDPQWRGLPLHSDVEGAAPSFVRTCAEWAAAVQAGRFAMSNRAMIEESEFILVDGILSAVAHAQPASQTGLADLNLAELARAWLSPRVARDTLEPDRDAKVAWTFEGNRIWAVDDSQRSWIEPVLFGDLDDDGWEDVLTFEGQGPLDAAFRVGSMRAYTRIGDGPLLDLTPRLPSLMPDAREVGRTRTLWHGNFGIAVGHPLALQGRCGCSGEEHGIRIELVMRGGIASGTLRCDRMPRGVPVAGVLGAGAGLLHATGDGGASIMGFPFEWEHAGGSFTMRGCRAARGAFDCPDFSATGTVPTSDERLRREGWTSEIRFEAGDSRLLLRRGCGAGVSARPADVLCLETDGMVTELARFDRIEWAASERHPEDEPASDAEMRQRLPRSVHRVHEGDAMLLLDACSYGASMSSPAVIAIPIRAGRLRAAELRRFDAARVQIHNGIVQVRTHDPRAGTDPDRTAPRRPPASWTWTGAGWSKE